MKPSGSIPPRPPRFVLGRWSGTTRKTRTRPSPIKRGHPARPQHPWAYNSRGNARPEARIRQALADYTRRSGSTRASPRRTRIGPDPATSPSRHARRQAAVASATRGCELTDWKNPAGLEALAEAYAEAGDFDAAVRLRPGASDCQDFDARLRAYRAKALRGLPEPNAPWLDPALGRSLPGRTSSVLHRPLRYDVVAETGRRFGRGSHRIRSGDVPGQARGDLHGIARHSAAHREVKVGFVAAGSELYFYMKTEWDGIRWAVSNDRNRRPGRSLSRFETTASGGMGRPSRRLARRRGYCTSMMSASEMTTTTFLIVIRLVPATPPVKP